MSDWGAKLKITGRPFYGPSTIELDGHELNGVKGIELRLYAGEVPEATLHLALEEVEVDSEFMLYLHGQVTSGD